MEFISPSSFESRNNTYTEIVSHIPQSDLEYIMQANGSEVYTYVLSDGTELRWIDRIDHGNGSYDNDMEFDIFEIWKNGDKILGDFISLPETDYSPNFYEEVLPHDFNVEEILDYFEPITKANALVMAR